MKNQKQLIETFFDTKKYWHLLFHAKKTLSDPSNLTYSEFVPAIKISSRRCILTFTEAVTRWCSIKKVFTKFTGKNTESCNFIKKEILKQLFSCKLCKIFKNSFFTGHFWTTAFNVCFSPTLYDFVLFSPLLDISHYKIRTS